MPTESAAMEMRPPSRIRRLSTNPSPCLPQQLRFGHAAIGEDHFAGGAGAHAELVFLLADLKPGRAFFQNERGNSVRRCAAIRHRHGDANVGDVRVGGEGLAAVEHPASRRRARPWCACRRRRSRLPARSATSSRSIRRRRASECTCCAARRSPRDKYDWCRAKCAPPRSARPKDRRARAPR